MLSNRNIKCTTYAILYLLTYIFKKEVESGAIEFNNLFYLAQYILNNIISTFGTIKND